MAAMASTGHAHPTQEPGAASSSPAWESEDLGLFLLLPQGLLIRSGTEGTRTDAYIELHSGASFKLLLYNTGLTKSDFNDPSHK